MYRFSQFKVISALMGIVLFQQTLFAEVDTQFITPDSSAAVVVYPQKVLTDKHLQMLPMEVLSAMSVQMLGIDPVHLDSVLLVAAPPAASGVPRVGVVASFNEPTSIDDLLPVLDEQGSTKKAPFSENGPSYRQAQSPYFPSFYQLDEKTILAANDEMLRDMLAQKQNPKSGPLANFVNNSLDKSDLQVFVAVEPIRDLASFMISPLTFPPGLAPVKTLPSQIDTISMKASITDSTYFEAKITTADEASAQEVQATLNQVLTFYQKMADAQFDENQYDSTQKALATYQSRLSSFVVETLKPKREGNVLTLSTKGKEQLTQQILIGYTMALVMPAVAQSSMAAQRISSTNNLRQLILTLHNYHDTYIRMPSQTMRDKDGKPLLSWRVHILPFLEQSDLYNQFHLDEPWDSEHNIKLIGLMPKTFRRPGSKAAPGMTNYQVPLAKGLPFQEHERLKFSNITDGLSNTIAILEVPDEKAVTWTKPDDFQIDLDNPLKGLVRKNQNGFTVVLFDGSARRIITETMTKEKFIKLLTHAGGEVVDF
ncbi:MAG: hypothetical protein COA78_04645 [Blastopirellula sp.]|nr:MAG: hypothetical protein COA78_04645 [Blastopirellula sp.]